MSDMWATRETDPRDFGTPLGEKDNLVMYLNNYRLTLEMKCDGLDADQLARRSVPPSALSLLGLVRHMALVEQQWFTHVLQGQTDVPYYYQNPDDRDWEINDARPDPEQVSDAFATWRSQRALGDAYLDSLDESALGSTVPHHDQQVAVRDVLIHLIEEYARHCGHADLLRECIDGRTGQ